MIKNKRLSMPLHILCLRGKQHASRASSTKGKKKPFPFFALPRELRDLTYSFMIRPSPINPDEVIPLPEGIPEEDVMAAFISHFPQPEVLRLCRRFREEYLEVYWRKVSLLVRTPFSLNADMMKTVPEGLKVWCRDVREVVWRVKVVTRQGVREDLEDAIPTLQKQIADLVHLCLRLRRLRIEFSVRIERLNFAISLGDFDPEAFYQLTAPSLQGPAITDPLRLELLLLATSELYMVNFRSIGLPVVNVVMASLWCPTNRIHYLIRPAREVMAGGEVSLDLSTHQAEEFNLEDFIGAYGMLDAAMRRIL